MFFSSSEIYETLLNQEPEPKGQRKKAEILFFEDKDGEHQQREYLRLLNSCLPPFLPTFGEDLGSKPCKQ